MWPGIKVISVSVESRKNETRLNVKLAHYCLHNQAKQMFNVVLVLKGACIFSTHK